MPALENIDSYPLCLDNSTYTSQEYHRIGGGSRHTEYQLFLSFRSRIPMVSDCSPANRERELGLDRHETC